MLALLDIEVEIRSYITLDIDLVVDQNMLVFSSTRIGCYKACESEVKSKNVFHVA